MNHDEYRRIWGHEDKDQMIEVISAGNPWANDALRDMVEYYEGDIIPLLDFDAKHLYGERIWELYRRVCGEMMQRFAYHLNMELPCQVCGVLIPCGPYYREMNHDKRRAHREARSGICPESFWVLANPPQTPFYPFPFSVST